MDLELTGRRALVTGGSKGIGRAIAEALAREGARVAIAARDPATLTQAAEELSAKVGATMHAIPVDTGDDASVTAMIAAMVEQLGGIDILVNCAARPGSSMPIPKLADTTTEIFWAEMNTKAMGYLRCCREAAPYMKAQGWGRIISVSGIAARVTRSAVGSMRNVAVVAMTKNLAEELAPYGINVTVVHPGVTRTERTPDLLARRAAAARSTIEEAERVFADRALIGRLVEMSEVASVVAFLASPKSVAINGDVIPVDGGTRGSIHY